MGRESAIVCPECGGYGEGCICEALDRVGVVNGAKARERRRRRRERGG